MPRRDRDGFNALWDTVVSEAYRRLVADSPHEVQRFREIVSSPEDGPRVARELGLKGPFTTTLEAGLACRQAIFRLATANASAEWLLLHRDQQPASIAAILTDAFRIYLPAYIDSVKKFQEAALGQVVGEDDDTRLRRREVATWSVERKKALSTGRETVAHAATSYISGITEEGLWAPMIILDLLPEEALIEMLKQDLLSDAEKFESCVAILRTVALRALAEGEAQWRPQQD